MSAPQPSSLQNPIDELAALGTKELSAWKARHKLSVALINEAMLSVRRLLEKADFETADRISDNCMALAREFRDPVITAHALTTKGVVLGRINEHAKALLYFDEALQLYEQAGEAFYAAKIRLNRIACYGNLSMYDDALRDGAINNEALTRIGEKRLLAWTYTNVGAVYARLDRPQEDLNALLMAEKLLLEIKDRKSLATVYENCANASSELNQFQEAYRYYRLSKELAIETGQTYRAACINYNLGCMHYKQGEYTEALNILAETRTAMPMEQGHVYLSDLTQSEIYLELNMNREAIAVAESAATGFSLTNQTFERAQAISVMARAYSQLNEYREAGRLFEQAKSMFQVQGNHVRAAATDLYQGLMWLQTGRNAEARAAARQAHKAFITEHLKSKAAFALVVSARANLNLGDLEAATRDAISALTEYEGALLPWVAYQVHAVLGEIYRIRGNITVAVEEFRRAIDRLEGVRANIAEDDLRLNFLKDKVPVYEMLLSCCLQQADAASLREAFTTAERSKGRTLVDLLAGSVGSLKQVTSSSIEDIQAALSPGSVLIEYIISDGRLSAFCLSKEGFEVQIGICSISELKRRFDFLQFHLSRLASGPPAAEPAMTFNLLNIQDHLQRLYELLVKPLETVVERSKSLVFVPYGFLHYLPFHALFDGTKYLIDRFQISYAPSATIYQLFKTKTPRNTGTTLLVGVPDANAPFIAGEIQGIESLWPDSRTLLAAEATQSRVADAMTTAKFVHLASHATFRADNPMFSSIQLHDTPMNFFDIYKLRTSAQLVTLSGCGTGLSSVVAGDELLGLVRGFLYAGATAVVTSLWDVNDRTTAMLMGYFYSYLAAGQSKSRSLQLAMLRLREDYPHPYHWAPFLLMGDPA